MFVNALTDIEQVFGDTSWTSNNITTYPSNYQGDVKDTEYCIVNVLPSNSENVAHGVTKQLSGLVAVKIFVPAGFGQKRVMEISDLLDNVLENKLLNNRTTLGSSYLNVEGLDPDNGALYSASYFNSFTLYGE